MTRFPIILAALDLTPMDEHIIRYTRMIAEKSGTERIYFVHVVPDLTVPKAADLEFRKNFVPEKPVDEIAKKKIEESVHAHFKDLPGVTIIAEAIEGRPYQKLLHWAEVKNADLVITGKKKISDGSGVTARRMARNVKKAAVLFVTEDAPIHINKVIVPVDYSENSGRALKTAIDLKSRDSDIKIRVAYVIDYPPTGFYLNKEEFSGFNKMLVDTAEASFQEFIDRYGISSSDVELRLIENAWHNIAGAIQNLTEKEHPDFMVVGAQGHSAFESFLFGSVTEKLVTANIGVPILVVR